MYKEETTLDAEMIFEDEVRDYKKVKLLKSETEGRRVTKSKKEPVTEVIQAINTANLKVKHMERLIRGLQQDLVDGTVVRSGSRTSLWDIDPSPTSQTSAQVKGESKDEQARRDDDSNYIQLDERDDR